MIVVVIAMYGECWLAWLLRVCSYKLAELLPSCRDQSIFASLVVVVYVGHELDKCVLSAQLNVDVV